MPVFPSHRRAPKLALATMSASLASALIFLTTNVAVAAPPEFGIWFDETGRGAVEIAPCGEKVCGRIVWLESNVGSDGKPLHDKYNPQPEMRARPICGIQVIGNLSQLADGTLGAGWVYDPKTGKSYDVEIKLAKPGILEVYGYAGLKLLGKSLYWKRAPNDLPSCGSSG